MDVGVLATKKLNLPLKSVSTQIALLSLAIVLLVGIPVGWFSIHFLSQETKYSRDLLDFEIRNDYDRSIKRLVLVVRSMLQELVDTQKSRNLSPTALRELGATLLRNLKYEDSGYFWADTYEGVNVVFLGQNTEGKPRINNQDANGKYYIRDLIEVGRRPGGGYVDYLFPRPGEQLPIEKRGYALAFEPFGWVIGTGNYVDEIDKSLVQSHDQYENRIERTVLVFVLLLLMDCGFAIILAFTMARWITLPLRDLRNAFNRLAKQNPNPEDVLPVRTTDEVGQLADAFNRFLKRLNQYISNEKAYWSLADKLALLAEAHDQGTSTHTHRVGALSDFIASRWGFSEEQSDRIGQAAVLHDVGKLFLSPELINKTGLLSQEEKEILKSHTLMANKLLDGPFFELERKIATYHHERYDGSGYPFGLVGDQIPIEAQIVGVADVYDALRMARSYKPELSPDVVLSKMEHGDDRMSSGGFNPELICLLRANIEEIERIWNQPPKKIRSVNFCDTKADIAS
jgi:HD-GYP domain-containing protein (c-di-GMP phosphodiesterase class II)